MHPGVTALGEEKSRFVEARQGETESRHSRLPYWKDPTQHVLRLSHIRGRGKGLGHDGGFQSEQSERELHLTRQRASEA